MIKMKESKIMYNDRLLAILYILSMTVAFTTRYGDLQLGYKLQIIIGIIWVILGFCKLFINGFKFKGLFKDDFPQFIKVYLLPHIIIHGYTILLMVLNKVEWKYFTSNLTVYIPTLLAIMAFYLLGTKAFEYTCVALILSWLLSVGTSLILKGPAIFSHAIIQAYIDPYDNTGGLTINYLELHDFVLAIGYIVIAYVFTNLKLNKRTLGFLFIVLILMILGMKRVSVLGILLAVVFYVFLKRFPKKSKYKICIIAGWGAFLICYLYIYLLSDGNVFYDYIAKYGINVMGRNYYYKAIMSYAKFSPTFIGIGRNVVTQLLNTSLSYLRVGGVHSDIIKMYVENGFVLFGFWLWYYLIYIFKFYKKKYGINCAILYFGIVIYMFTLYLTDNIEIYFICQILSIMIPIKYALDTKKLSFDECKVCTNK